VFLNYNFSKEQCTLPEVDRMIETCRSFLSIYLGCIWESHRNWYLFFRKTFTEMVSKFDTVICTSFQIPVSARSRAWVYGRSLPGTAGSNPADSIQICLL